MSRQNINDLRDHLFETLKALRDPASPMDVSRAQAVADVAKVVVDSVKVEVEFVKATGALSGSGFVPTDAAPATGPRAVGAGQAGRRLTAVNER